MATTKNNVIVKGASGKFGRQIVFSQRAGKTIMSKPPVRTAPPTTKQKEQQAKFARAAAYAKNALLDPSLKADYTAEAKKRQDVSAYNMAMTDYLRPPVITEVNHSAYTGTATNQKIIIEVADAFKVIAVKVQIEDADESPVEQGNATLIEGKWTYTTTATNASIAGDKIIITATDRPGNTTKKEITL